MKSQVSKSKPYSLKPLPTGRQAKPFPKVFVGLSGGVDSSVSAAILKKQGYDVTGVFIRVWQPEWIECTWKEDRLDAMRVCAKLGIPFIELNLEKEYKKEVVDYMISEYKKGNTPNPDVMCNKYVKFGGFYDWAIKNGADFVATGHYSRIRNYELGIRNGEKENSNSKLPTTDYQLLTGLDSQKDQSYFLWQIRKEQLPHILFPVGGLEKPEVRRLAKKFGLVTADKKDSQGLCFLGKIDMKDFLKRHIKEKPGKVLLAPSLIEGNERGEVIGTHDGAVFFTLGERHGFKIRQNSPRRTEDQMPYYVVAKDVTKNTITVSSNPRGEVGADSKKVFKISQVNWLGGAPVIGKKYFARIRYRQPLQEVRIMNKEPALPAGRLGIRVKNKNKKKSGTIIHNSVFIIQFQSTQSGGAPGQSIVIYDGDACIGGGIIS